jgi:hypothetical protein
MILALSTSWEITLGLIAIFFVAFPLLVQGLLVFIAIQVAGERRENQEHSRRMTGGSTGG